MKKRFTQLFSPCLSILIITLAGCGDGGGSSVSSSPPQTEDGKRLIIAEEGGTITCGDEIIFNIPENSLSADTEIEIRSISEIPSGEAESLQPFGQAYKFTPEGTTFELSEPAILEIKYDEQLLSGKGYSPETLQICYYDETEGKFIAVESHIDIHNKTVIALVEHFTIYVPMARAKLPTNNSPYVALQNSIPNPPRADAPIYVRATARDYDGSIAGVKLFYRKLQPSAGIWNQAVMLREVRPNVLNTYGFTIPAGFLSSSDLGTGNDIEYYVSATDNLGAVKNTSVRSVNVTRKYQPGTINISPASLNIVAGFERYFTIRANDNLGTSFQLIPEAYALTLNKGTISNKSANGLLFSANAITDPGTPEILTAWCGWDSASSSINIYSGEIASIEILDTNSQKIEGTIIINKGIPYEFDAVGYDEFGNRINIYPSWSTDSSLGTIDNDGKLTTDSSRGSGKVYISLGNYSDEKTVNVILDSSFKVEFDDIDEKTGTIGGDIIITKAVDETLISGYTLYWGSDSTTKLNGNPAIATMPKTGTDITYNLPLDTVSPAGATHVLCFPVFGGVEYSFFSSTPVIDVTGSIAPVPGESGDITVTSKTVHTITVEWTAANDNLTPADLLEYTVYYSTASDIETLSNAQANGTLAMDWAAGINMYKITSLNANTSYYIMIFVRDSGGNISSYTVKNESTLTDLPIHWCRTDGEGAYDPDVTGTSGEIKLLCGQIYSSAITEYTGSNPGIRAQLGIGPAGASCVNNGQWTWYEATYFEQTGNNDRYRYALTLPSPGNYEFVMRFSGDGGETWTYADTFGTNYSPGQPIRPFDPSMQGTLTVH